MADDMVRLISGLCDAWCDACEKPDGTIIVGNEAGNFELMRNGIKFHNLNYSSLVASITGLSRVLLQKRKNAIIGQDHIWLLAWCTEVLVDAHWDGSRRLYDESLFSLITTIIHAFLSNVERPLSNLQDHQDRFIAFQATEAHHLRQLGNKVPVVISYLAFPLLEAALRRACARYVRSDGKVIADFERKSGGSYKVGSRCSNLLDLLNLHYKLIADEDLRRNIDIFRSHLEKVAEVGGDGFSILYDWRCSSMHGSENEVTVGVTVMSYAFLVLLQELKPIYEECRVRAELISRQHVRQFDYMHHMAFYPPERGFNPF